MSDLSLLCSLSFYSLFCLKSYCYYSCNNFKLWATIYWDTFTVFHSFTRTPVNQVCNFVVNMILKRVQLLFGSSLNVI